LTAVSQSTPVDVVGDQQVAAAGGMLACHASRPLGTPHPQVSHLLIVVHGALRNSADYLGHAVRAAELAGAAERTLAVAPQFLADVDGQSGRVLSWDVEGWKGGEPALSPAPVSSFTAMDCLLGRLAGAARTVVIAGHSAGGQFVNRYAIVGRLPGELAVRFVISNPSSYLYFSPERPVLVPDPSQVNRWRYGFEDPPGYVDRSPQEYLRRYLGRDVSIVLGAQDRDPAAVLLEVSPPAMAQGPNRLDRGIHYHRHVRQMARRAGLPARHRLITLPGVGHDGGDVLAAPQTREILFGPGPVSSRA
jgi:hypothetical protein